MKPRRRYLRILACVLAMACTGAALGASGPVAGTPGTRARAYRIDWAGDEGAGAGSIGDRSVSYSTWSLSGGDTFIVRYLLPIVDAERVAGTDIEVLVQQRLGDYLLAHLAVRDGGQDCPAIDQGYDIGRVDPLTVAAGLYGFEIFFRCPQLAAASPAASAIATPVELEDRALFDRIPGHVDFARVQIGGTGFSPQLFTRQHQQLLLPGDAVRAAPASAGLSRYAALGIGNVLGSLDRLCFLFGMLLLMLDGRQAAPQRVLRLLPVPTWLAAPLYVLTGLALGYALSLLAALAGGLVPRERLLDAAIGFMVALVAARIATRPFARPRVAAVGAGALLCLALLVWLAHGHWPALLLIGIAAFAGGQLAAGEQLEREPFGALLLPALFGFLDGFVLPAEVVPLQLSGHAVLPMAVGFDLGALLTELAVLITLGLALATIRAWPRTRSLLRHSGLTTDLAATALGGAGVFWMLSRLHG